MAPRQPQDALHEPQQRRVELVAVVDDPFAVAADDPAPSRREVRRRPVHRMNRASARDAHGQLGQVAGLAEQVELEREERLLAAAVPNSESVASSRSNRSGWASCFSISRPTSSPA